MAYVFGGDNADFMKTFVGKGMATCVERKGFESKFNLNKNDVFLSKNPNLIFVPSGDHSHVSSSHIRKEELKSQKNINNKSPVYIIRDDSVIFHKDWNPSRIDDFKKGLKEQISQATEKNVSWFSVKKEQEFIESMGQDVLNFDVATKTKHKIRISRIFNVSDSQIKSSRIQNRPHSLTLDEQLKKIPAGEYVVVDDDIASGETINFIKRMLPPKIKIKTIRTLTEFSFYEKFNKNKKFEFYDIVDLRDFLFGANEGGLVVTLPSDKVVRVPYVFPYVNLVSRGKIPYEKVQDLSKAILSLNYTFFKNSGILLKTCSPAFIDAMIYVGFSRDDKLEDICRWHIDLMS